MPKKLTITLSLLLSFSLLIGTACDKWFGGEGESTPTATPTQVTTNIPTQTPEQLASELSVHFIDVGQGDAILLDAGSFECLIDGGDGKADITNYLKDYVDGNIELVVATHPHADHIGGLISVLDEFNVGGIWLNGDTSTSKTYDDFMGRVNSEDNAVVNVVDQSWNDSWDLCDYFKPNSTCHLEFDILNPSDTLFNDTNDNSIVILATWGNVSFLFTGDAEQEAESSMISAGVLKDVDILKVGHHASRTATSQPFLDIVKPEVAIYMAGVGNTYGHPHAETITKLNDIGAEIYGTDVNGTITVTTDGVTYTIQTEK